MSDLTPKVHEINILRPREDLVRHLENLVNQAKSGELTGIIVVSLWQGGDVGSGWSLPNGHNLRTMLGEIDILKHNLIDDDNERSGT